MTAPTVEQFLFRRRVGRAVVLAAIAAALAVLVWADRHGYLLHDGSDWQRYEGRSFTVVRVIDGDTIEIDLPDGPSPATQVRLWGIDVSEKADVPGNRSAGAVADAAAAFVRQRCRGRAVRLRLEAHRLREHDGRLLAYVELPDGSLLNEQLLAHGLARADERFDHRLRERFAMIEYQARHDRIGLWTEADNHR